MAYKSVISNKYSECALPTPVRAIHIKRIYLELK